MRVEIRIGESAGEGEDLLEVGLVVQMQGTLLEDGEVNRELFPQIPEDAELVEDARIFPKECTKILMSKGPFEYSYSWIQSKCSTHTREYRARVYSYSTHFELRAGLYAAPRSSATYRLRSIRAACSRV